MRRAGAAALGVLLAWLAAAGCGDPREAPALEIRGEAMGTTWSVKTGARPDSVPAGRLEREMEGVLARVDAHMSTYRADSELSRFNRAERTDWIPVSTETALVVGEALRVAELSSGAFDPTVAPLVELWGFEPHPNPAIPPSRAKIAAALERVGHRLVEVREAPPALRKRRPDVALDLSGIAKGYAVDALEIGRAHV